MIQRPVTSHSPLGRSLATLLLAACCLLPSLFGSESADSSSPTPAFRPGELWLDTDGVHINAHSAGILYQDNTYWWFGEHKIAGRAGNVAHVGVSVYSSRDLYHWKNEGVALSVSDDPAHELAKGCIIERPKVLHNPRTGKFVMWFHLEHKGAGYNTARSGVAVADSVTGPYRFLGSFLPNAGVWPLNVPPELQVPLTPEEHAKWGNRKYSGGPFAGYPTDIFYRLHHAEGQMARDMTLFQDDDGKAYHIYSSEQNGTLHISQLSDDYLSPAGRYVRIFPGGFNEAPALFKHLGKYYLFSSDCSGWKPNPGRLAVADSIFGPWTALGNPCVGTEQQRATTFESQSTFVLPVQGKPGAFIFLADRWRPDNAIDGRYVWLPVRFAADGRPYLEWMDSWDLSFFDQPARP